MVTEIVAADIGGTHARFALAEVDTGRVARLGEEVTLRTAEHASLADAWTAFAGRLGRQLPKAAAIAVAAPIQGDLLRLTNNQWSIRPSALPAELGVERLTVVNDFGAVAHAVAQLEGSRFLHVGGPDRPLPREGVISIVGPGTGLGVAQLIRRGDDYQAVETEGGHMDFAPLDELEDQLLRVLRQLYGRVSIERLASGPGLLNLYGALARIEEEVPLFDDDKELWAAAMSGQDWLAAAALDRFCLILGAVAGDIALAQGASALVIAGGVGVRLAAHLRQSGFRDRFLAKGRFEAMMADMPMKLIMHPQPGLFGAAAAFAREYPG
jgi:glucokinase